jgi:L-threonylcarbamoyladenylate synthase
MPVILDWRQAAAPDNLARQTAQALADGGIVVLPSEAGYILAADPTRLADPTRPSGLPGDLIAERRDGFFDPAEFFVIAEPTAAERALALRVWPGPLGWAHDNSLFPAWVPSHTALASVLAGRQAPLALFELNGGQTVDPAQLGDAIALVVTDGPPRPGPITLLRPNDTRWTIIRNGVMTETDVRAALARRIVFVCTGNTCRSPMAEGLFKRRLADRLGCEVSELADRGFAVTSAGIAATTGDAATPESADALRDFGIDLSGHRSRLASSDLIARADDIVVMTRGHLVSLVGKYPVLNGSLRMLCGPDGDLDDPIGGGPDVYRACAATIRLHVDRLITEMGLP